MATQGKKGFLKIKRTGGTRGLTKGQRATFAGLGLRKNQRTVVLEDSNSVRGMVNQVIHWVEVEMLKSVPEKAAKKSKGYEILPQKNA